MPKNFESDAGHEPYVLQTNFPPCFGVRGLSALIGKDIATILADRSRAPHRLPPACSPPGTRSPTWLLSDVLAWLAAHREAPVVAPGHVSVERSVAPGRGGRPTKIEQREAEKLGISVRDLRARRVDEGAHQ